MDFPVEILALPGALADASWNGVAFYMPDETHTVGRRVQRFFFPGQDQTAYQDLGAFDGPMHIRGLYVGDDYVQAAQALEAAFRTPGPGTLVHPWYGDLQMVLVEPAKIGFAQKQLRVVTIEATFAPFLPETPAATSSLDALLSDVAAAQAAVQAWLGQALAAVGTAIWLVGQVESYASTAQAYWQVATGVTGITGAAGNPTLSAAVAPSIAALGGVSAVPVGAGYAAAVGGLLAGVPAAIVGASATLEPSAVGPGDAAVTAAPIDGRITMAILQTANGAALAQVGQAGVSQTLVVAQAAMTIAAAIQAATTIDWDSAQEAQAALASLLASIDATEVQVALASQPTLAGSAAAVQAGLLWMQLADMRATFVADMTSTIGRLPQVLTMQTSATLPAWVIANILAGDNPALIIPTYQDLVTRNTLANPALVPPGNIEVLAPASLPTLLGAAA